MKRLKQLQINRIRRQMNLGGLTKGFPKHREEIITGYYKIENGGNRQKLNLS